MTARQAPSWLTPDLRARWDAHEEAARLKVMTARWDNLRKRASWAVVAFVFAALLASGFAWVMGIGFSWDTAGLVLSIATAGGASVMVVDISPTRAANGQQPGHHIERPKAMPLVPPNQGSARMRPDDGGGR